VIDNTDNTDKLYIEEFMLESIYLVEAKFVWVD